MANPKGKEKRSMPFQTLEVNTRGSFQVLDVAIELASTMRQPAEVLRGRDPGLYRQLREATNSIALNIGESRGRNGRDRLHHLRIAAGSAEEVRTALRLAATWGDLRQEAIEPALRLVDRILSRLWRLTH
jgi:four helix bundle protein